MTYFILHKNESKENLMFSSNILGEESLGSFYPEQGWVALNNMININGQDNGTVIIEAGSTVETTGGKSNPINGNAASGLTITNSGTIKSASSKAINLTDATTGTLTNNSGGVIQAKTNTISMFGADTDDVTIHNNGTIFATDDDDEQTNTIKSHDNSTNITINNNSGGHIYHTSQGAVIYLAGGATLNNSGKIENKDGPTLNSIGILGSTGVTLNLKEEGIIIGKINIAGSGHTIKVNHGMGRSYYYNTSGTGTYDLEDLDGNIIVKGSVGSVAQGGNEILDEQLGHKSINLRKSISKFKRSEQYLNQEDAWTEVFSSFEKRQGEKKSLRLEHNNLRACSENSGAINISKNNLFNSFADSKSMLLLDINTPPNAEIGSASNANWYEAIKFSPWPIPTTNGLPLRAAAITPGSVSQTAPMAYAPLKSFTAS